MQLHTPMIIAVAASTPLAAVGVQRAEITAAAEPALSAADVGVAANVRQALLDDRTLSTNAKSVGIFHRRGAITLTGPVDSEYEKNRVEDLARGVDGVTSVINQLVVKENE